MNRLSTFSGHIAFLISIMNSKSKAISSICVGSSIETNKFWYLFILIVLLKLPPLVHFVSHSKSLSISLSIITIIVVFLFVTHKSTYHLMRILRLYFENISNCCDVFWGFWYTIDVFYRQWGAKTLHHLLWNVFFKPWIDDWLAKSLAKCRK